MKKILTLALTLTLLSCGFTPMYSADTISGTAIQRDIFITPISGTNGIDLRNALRAKFGTDNDSPSAKYTLSVDLKNPETILKALQITGDATWQEVRLTAHYILKETATGNVIVTATDTASESYTFVRDLVAAKASHNNAAQNATRILAEKISTRVNAKLANGDK